MSLHAATIAIVFGMVVLGGFCTAAEWYVGPNGSSANAGTKDSPWDLKSALLGQHKQVAPGDTIWLTRGIYSIAPATAMGWDRAYSVTLSGTKEKPIIVRAAPTERVTIDGALILECHDVWFQGFEIATLVPRNADPENYIERPQGGIMTKDGARCRVINCVFSNNRQGMSWWAEAVDAEVYGCIFDRDGGENHTPGRGHDLYTQNKEGTKRIVDNIFWGGYQYGIHAYTQEGSLIGYHIEGNILFSKGVMARRDGCTNALVGGVPPASRIEFVNNYSYMHPASDRVNTSLSYSQIVNGDLVCSGNIFANGRYALALGSWERITGSGNWFFGRADVAMVPAEKLDAKKKGQYSWDNNEYVFGTADAPFEEGWTDYKNRLTKEDWQKLGLDKNSRFEKTMWNGPRGVKVIVRPNQHEPGRAHIAVFNWDRVSAISVDLSGVLKAGQPYRIFNVQNLWGDPVARGIYDGKPVAVPTLLSWVAPEFDAYLVLPTAEGDAR